MAEPFQNEHKKKLAAPPEPYTDPFLTLGIPRTASTDQIKDAYFGLVREHPPEREPDQFKVIRAAYDRLRTPERRLEAEMLLLQELDAPTDWAAPEFDLQVHRQDLLALARALSDVERTDFREHFRKV